MVTCMADSEQCDQIVGDWYWIYYVGPFLAAWFVAELTHILEMDVGDDEVEEPVSSDSAAPLKAAESIEPAATSDENDKLIEVGA